ncbi:Xanthine dehydrogenase, molybdenum binding subunit [Fulvivirga imtechensis AK7]|uniref:Xanthine dehydrogenase, molybdenum binding subunit n=1 Tax=Fulvivirga imtechensis AK7 TaxID=1237149 RepID=L8JST1_9BACT|nr:molybdopterin cofactor-binding domain-containing protein [Fulvivirga imtechensis]ELR72031.1 Xanthine dehydrogenase, molybdenum binding subunit [Fulvivirga imtechensis AK7]
MKNIDSKGHVRGESIYLDDIPVQIGTLHGEIFDAPCAHGKIKNVDYSQAEQFPGVVRIITFKDIPGENQIGGIIPDEPLFAEDEVHFWGMPVALIIATSEFIARQAKKLIKIDIEELDCIVDPKEAREKGSLIFPPRTFKIGDVDSVWEACEHVFEGEADSEGQEHLYIETQGAYAFQMENGNIRIASSTQGPTAVQRTAARVLGVGMHKIEVDVTRLGGGFGGKEDQATSWAVMAALGAHLLKRPVKIVLHRMDDMCMTGKRHPYRSDFKIGLSKDFKIKAYQVTFHQNAGAAADLSPAVMERTLFHATNSYHIPNVTATAYSCKTHLPPNTAFRGFGGPQGMFVIESAIAKAAHELGIDASRIQERNLLKDGDELPYGQVMEHALARKTWATAHKKFQLEAKRTDIADFNQKNKYIKKGLAIQPVCFGISFTNTSMNNARALVHIYSDGSVGVSTGAVEMGQGVNTKMLQVAANAFSIAPEKVKLETTNTTRVANTSPSAASATADLNGKALQIACDKLLTRLKETAANMVGAEVSSIELQDEQVYCNNKPAGIKWEKLIQTAFLERVCLTENGHYATPVIHFDKTKEKGHPFAYHVYGTAILVVTVDCIRGIYTFDSVEIVHDFGKSMNETIDLGQIEGGLVQGMGWMTMEELKYNSNGKLLSNALSTYKIPDIYSVPKEIKVEALETEGHEMAIRKSKAVGEPPLMYGLGAYFAIQNAVKAFNPNYQPKYHAPFTPEKVLLGLYEKVNVSVSGI